MEEIKCEQVGMLSGGKWEKLHDISRRVYSADGIAPTVHTMGGGQQELKILVPEATKKGCDTATYGDSINMAFPNSKTRRWRVGHGVAQTLTTQETQQAVVEPIIYDDYNGRIRADQDCIGTLTTNCGSDAPRNGMKIIEPSDYRIRKLTPNECFRLQGVKQEDFERVAENQSTSALYHEAGDSICCACLMAIFGQLFEIDYKTKINQLVGELQP